jgi:phage-related holin
MVKSDLLRTATITFYISNEAISILENVGKTGVKYPKQLKNILKEFSEKKKNK